MKTKRTPQAATIRIPADSFQQIKIIAAEEWLPVHRVAANLIAFALKHYRDALREGAVAHK
jgi:hypothetical protein